MGAQKGEDAGSISNDISLALDTARCSAEVRRDVFARTWTMDQIPPVETDEQADMYRRAAKQLWQKCSAGAESFVAFAHTQEGMLANAFDARVLEWEEGGD